MNFPASRSSSYSRRPERTEPPIQTLIEHINTPTNIIPSHPDSLTTTQTLKKQYQKSHPPDIASFIQIKLV